MINIKLFNMASKSTLSSIFRITKPSSQISGWPKTGLKAMPRMFQLESWARRATVHLNTSWLVKNTTFVVHQDSSQFFLCHRTKILTLKYFFAGHLTAKSDVYSFGVVLLELLTGRRSVDKTRPSREQNLVQWAKPFLKNSKKLNRIMDSSLDGQYSTLGAQRAAALAHRCLSGNQKARPLMRTVLETLETLLDLDDIRIGPFVYTVMADDKNDEDDAKERSDAKHHDQRHKLRFPDSTIHCDTGLNRKALRHKSSE